MAIIRHNPILRETAHALIPVIFLYALYVQFHGDFGPGGGFQAGVIFSVGFIIYGLTYGFEKSQQILSLRTAEILACLGALVYGGTGFFGILLGGEYLEYNVLANLPLTGQHLGIFLVELGVGMTIVGVIVGIFHRFTEKVK